MNLETIFSTCSTITMIGWLLLILSPLHGIIKKVVIYGIIPFLLSLVYLYLIANNFAGSDGGFSSLADVKLLFTNDHMLLAGWIHYLAFDLWVGSWELSDSKRRGIHHLIMIPILLATFMLGPIGLVLYFIVRAITTKKIMHEDNF